MKKLSIVMAAVICMTFGINAFAAGPRQPVAMGLQKGQYVSYVKKAPVTYVRVQQPQPRQVVVVNQAPRYYPQPRYVYVQPQPRVVVLNDRYANTYTNNSAAIVAAGLLGIGLIVAAVAN